jgi:tellurite resistance protein
MTTTRIKIGYPLGLDPQDQLNKNKIMYTAHQQRFVSITTTTTTQFETDNKLNNNNTTTTIKKLKLKHEDEDRINCSTCAS